VWRIRRKERSSGIDIFKIEETGHGDILSDEFINWRIKLALNSGNVTSATEVTGIEATASEVTATEMTDT
jgi:hypothetical protein